MADDKADRIDAMIVAWQERMRAKEAEHKAEEEALAAKLAERYLERTGRKEYRA